MKIPAFRIPQFWTAQQRDVLIGVLCALFGYFVLRFALNPSYVSDPQPREPARYHDLADKIDPNEVDWPTLAALPGIGEKRAKDIIAYRERFGTENPGERAFTRAEDLLRIRGFGYAIVTQLKPFLVFPKPNASTSQPER